METTVKVKEIQGKKFFCIYEVRAVQHNGDTITSDRFLDEKDAKEYVAFIHGHLNTLYDCAYIREQWVWC